MMLHSSILGTYASRADGFVRGQQRSRSPNYIGGGGPAPSFNPSSAFVTPRSSLALAAYGSPPRSSLARAAHRAPSAPGGLRHEPTATTMQPPSPYHRPVVHHELRSSPTSVAGFDRRALPYDDMNYCWAPDDDQDRRRAGIADDAGIRRDDVREARPAAAVFRPSIALPPPPPIRVVAPPPSPASPAAVDYSSASLGRRRASDRGPNASAGDGRREQQPERLPALPPPPASEGDVVGRGRSRSDDSGGEGNQPSPQNLRDNPERLAKVKTEMCHFYEKGGVGSCPYGKNCNYAHGKHELRFRYTTLRLMESSGQIANACTYLARPCMTWVSTGACPFGRRCAAIHDPTVAGPWENPSWLPAATANTNAQVIIDRLAAHRDNVVHQENPLIAQSIWENCRPSQRGRSNNRIEGCTSGDASKGFSDRKEEWEDTYALICNSRVLTFSGGIVHSNATSNKLSELQKLCIVRLLRSGDGVSSEESSSQLHKDYVFAPTHSLHSELAMILQARYFLLLDVDFTNPGHVSPEDIVKEISSEEHKTRTIPWSNDGHPFDPSVCVTAHEVAFAPLGDHNANVSIWFDAFPVKLQQSQIKRSRRLKQKKKTSIRNEHTRPNGNGALISRTSAADFPGGRPDIDPFVPMLPADDNEASHTLIIAVMEHRIASIILSNCSSVDVEQRKNLDKCMNRLWEIFVSMAQFQEKWTWPKREGMENVNRFTMAPPGNIMPYIPLKTHKESPCMEIWHTFVKAIAMVNTHADHLSKNDEKRLSIFLSLDGSVPRTDPDGNPNIPRILPDAWWNAETGPTNNIDGTWREIMLGLPENGKWKAALRLHEKKKEDSNDDTIIKARNMPLSTIPFVQ